MQAWLTLLGFTRATLRIFSSLKVCITLLFSYVATASLPVWDSRICCDDQQALPVFRIDLPDTVSSQNF